MSESFGFDSETVANVRFLVSSHAWADYLVPRLQSIRANMFELLADPSKKRKDDLSDDYIRGCIATLGNFLELPQVLIDDADVQAARRAEDQTQEDHFSSRAELGLP